MSTPASTERIKAERDVLSAIIDEGFRQGLGMIELCAAFQTLQWVLNPAGHAPPIQMGLPSSRRCDHLQIVK